MELATAPGDVSCRRVKRHYKCLLNGFEVAGMKESWVRFTRTMTPVGGALPFGCNVEYLSDLDQFLPGDLKRGRELLDGFQARIFKWTPSSGQR